MAATSSSRATGFCTGYRWQTPTTSISSRRFSAALMAADPTGRGPARLGDWPAMGLFRKRKAAPAPVNTDPQEALRIAREAMAKTGTYVDEHGHQRKLTPESRDNM